MTIFIRTVAVAAALTGAASCLAGPAAKTFAEPPVPVELVTAGTVYHTIHDREAQVIFNSETPFENIVGKSNKVVGYAVEGPGDQPSELAGAHWILPVDSLATGIPLRDHHLAGSDWLDGEAHPTIEFALDHVEDRVLVKSGDGFSTWDMTLVGTMTMHGISNKIRVPKTRVSFIEGSEKTATIAPGNLLFMKSVYTVRLSDFGIKNGDVPDKVADEITLNQTLRLSTEILDQPR